LLEQYQSCRELNQISLPAVRELTQKSSTTVPFVDGTNGTVVRKLIDEYKFPSHKILPMLHKGREKLRLKYSTVREELRVVQNQVRAVESRD